ncbi:MAG: outer membrane beta-barrel protein [Chitinophagaceae bacterium]
MKIIVFFTFILICFTSAAQMPGNPSRAAGQQLTGRFYGRVVNASNKGVEAASVILVRDNTNAANRGTPTNRRNTRDTTAQKTDTTGTIITNAKDVPVTDTTANANNTAANTQKEVIVGGMLTSPGGEFSIENVPAMGRYKLRITGIGYKPVELSVNFTMPNRNSGDPSGMLGALDKDLGNIKIEIDDKLLSGVTVTATKPMLQMGIDRKIFNVDRNLVSVGGTAVDVMKNVPSVNVDIDGNVTVRNTAPQLFVDGMPTNLTLEEIPADVIESVEIITNPSAKFDASGGTAGILNIVLKKNRRVGYSGNIRTNIDSRAKVGFGGDLNLRQNKLNFFASGQLHPRKSISEGTTDRLTNDIIRVRSVQLDNNTSEGNFAFGRAGFDYFINNRNTISISGSFARGNFSPFSTSDIYIYEDHPGVDTSRYNARTTNSARKIRNMGTQLSFKHLFPKAGNEWTAALTYNKGKNENSSNIRTENYIKNPSPERFLGVYNQTQFGSGNNENLVIQTDYTNQISDNSKFELGARASIRTINSATNYVISNKSSSTIYSNEDRIYAAYSTFSNRIKDFGYQLGLRAESSVNEGVLNKNQSFKKEFPISFFPSLFLSQKLNETDDLQLNYSRRINRPNFFQLFPFTDYSDSLNISRGNPDLDPEFTNSLELSYSKIFKNRDNFLVSGYFKNTNDLITSFLDRQHDEFLGKEVLVSSYINANRSYVTGLELTSRNKLTKWWDVTSNANFFTAKTDLENQPDPDQFLSYFLKLNNSFKLPKNITMQISGDYQSRRISSPGGGGGNRGGGGFGGGGGGMFFGGWGGMFFGGGGSSASQGYIRPNYGVDAALRYEFLKDRAASLSLSVNDIFRTKKYDAHLESRFFVQDVERRRDAQIFRLNFNWRFGKFDPTLFKRKNTKAESDVNMEGINQ